MSELNDSQMEDLKKLLAEGRKLEAIKCYREFTGSGLKESKEWVDRLQADQVKDQPELYQNRSSGGCFGLVLIALGAGPLGYALTHFW